jgi:hypothetical protein
VPVGAENVIQPGHAASRYSWISPKTVSLPRSCAGSGSQARVGVSVVSGAC